jgi:uncharacterized protein
MQRSSGEEAHLCSACGLCCNGVLFEMVHVQPSDSAKALSALGLKIKHKRQQPYFLQPCPAHRCHTCSIYEDRPDRCRAFSCGQLEKVGRGECTQEVALQKIQQAKRLVDEVLELLLELGEKNRDKPLMARFRAVLDHPVESYLYPELKERREQLIKSLGILANYLHAEFHAAARVPDP